MTHLLIKTKSFFRSAHLVVIMLMHLSILAQPQVPKVVDFANMKLQLTDEARRMIQKDVNALHASKTHLQQRLDVINLYFPIIERIFKEEGIPDEIKYLVIQESGLIADAVSVSDAVGFWQFKDFTAREVGLRVDGVVDERKNIVSATYGAAKYLKRNHFQFDNWAYAISAYQAGLGGVRRFVDKKYYGAKKMPIDKNTHWYLMKFIAHKVAFESIIGGRHSSGLRLEEYTKGGGKTLEKIAKASKIEEELLMYYNKWVLKKVIPEDKTYTVILPVQGKLPKGLFEEEELPQERVITEIEQPDQLKFPSEIKPGISDHRNSVAMRVNGVRAILAGTNDNLASLAADAGISPDKLLEFNDLTNSNISSGKLYYVARKKTKSDIGFHVTKSDQSLWDVSQQYAIRLDKLAKRNRIEPTDEITMGQVIWLSGRRPKGTPFEYHDVTSNTLSIVEGNIQVHESEIPSDEKLQAITNVTEAENPTKQSEIKEDINQKKESLSLQLSGYKQTAQIHTVMEGETLWSIARMYEISVDEIREWNRLTKYDVLRIGQKLYVREPRLEKKPERATSLYIVRGGDTLYQIAKRFNMSVTELMDLNGKNTSSLSVGEELKVYRQ
jgi:membrane-bound lytic murein transglycosylase D